MNGRIFLCLACVFAMRVAARDPKSPSLRSAVEHEQDHDQDHDEDSPTRSRRFIIGMPAKRARDDPSERLVLGRDGWYRPVFEEQPENDVYDDVADYYTSTQQPPMRYSIRDVILNVIANFKEKQKVLQQQLANQEVWNRLQWASTNVYETE